MLAAYNSVRNAIRTLGEFVTSSYEILTRGDINVLD